MWAFLTPILDVLGLIAIALSVIGLIGTERGRSYCQFVYDNFKRGNFAVIIPHLTDFAPALHSIEQIAKQLFTQYGIPLANDLAGPFQGLAKSLLTAQQGALASLGLSTPANAKDAAAEAFTVAFGAGISSAAVTALFEAVFPEKLNTLNGVGPMIAQMAGFKEVARNTLQPLYSAAFGVSLEYEYLSQFRPKQIDLGAARAAFSRRLISQAQFEQLAQLHGLAPQWVATEEAAAYRPISPFVLARAVDDTNVDLNPILDAMHFAGYRDADITGMVNALENASLKSAREEFLKAAEANYINGLITQDEWQQLLNFLNISGKAQNLIEGAAIHKRLKLLAETYKKGWDAELLAEKITVADYRVALAGLGYDSPNIDALVGSMSQRLDAIEFKSESAITKAQRRKDQELAVTAAMTAYKRNEIDLPALSAALLVAGLDVATAALYVALATARGRIAEHTVSQKFTKAQQLDIKAANEQYLAGVINVTTLRTLLAGAGMTVAEINPTVDYLDARGAKGQAQSAPGPGSLRRG